VGARAGLDVVLLHLVLFYIIVLTMLNKVTTLSAVLEKLMFTRWSSRLLWNSEIRYRDHKSQPVDPNLESGECSPHPQILCL
jgi:hypothetical protein